MVRPRSTTTSAGRPEERPWRGTAFIPGVGTISTAHELNRALSEIHRSGLAFLREEVDLGLVSVAAPLAGAGRAAAHRR